MKIEIKNLTSILALFSVLVGIQGCGLKKNTSEAQTGVVQTSNAEDSFVSWGGEDEPKKKKLLKKGDHHYVVSDPVIVPEDSNGDMHVKLPAESNVDDPNGAVIEAQLDFSHEKKTLKIDYEKTNYQNGKKTSLDFQVESVKKALEEGPETSGKLKLTFHPHSKPEVIVEYLVHLL